MCNSCATQPLPRPVYDPEKDPAARTPTQYRTPGPGPTANITISSGRSGGKTLAMRQQLLDDIELSISKSRKLLLRPIVVRSEVRNELSTIESLVFDLKRLDK